MPTWLEQRDPRTVGGLTVEAPRTHERTAVHLRPVESRLTLKVLEQSRYALRMILLLYTHSPSSITWLVRHIPTSPNTVIRCARVLEMSGLIVSWREEDGRCRHLYALTPIGGIVAGRPPSLWADVKLLKP